ncbi:hypothetical protein ACLOJK_004259 [Asimina triloba]
MLSSGPLVDVESDVTSHTTIFWREPLKASGEAETPMCRGVLRSTLGEASSCPTNDQFFHRPFDTKVRALKILGNLLPIQSRGIRECHALGLPPSLNKKGRGLGKRMLLEFLPDMWWELLKLKERIRLIDRCASQTEYRYHVPGVHVRLFVEHPQVRDPFRMSRIINEAECRRVIAARKRPKETRVTQRRLSPKLVVWRQRGWRLNWSNARPKVERDEAHDDIEGISLVKQDLKQALAEATMEAGDLRLLLSELNAVKVKRDEVVDSAIVAREEASRFSTELIAFMPKAEALHARGSREAKLLAESKVARAELAQLRIKLEESWADLEHLQVASSQGVIAEYLWSDIQRREEEFEHSHHSWSGYVKALSDVNVLFLGIDLSSLHPTP